MTDKHLIVDGNNLIHHARHTTHPGTRNMDEARVQLIRELEMMSGVYDRVTVVFDGRGTALHAERASPTVEVLFSPSDLTADSIIERLVHSSAHPESILIVTSDRSERDTVEAAGGTSMSCSNFVDVLERRRRQLESEVRMTRIKARGPTMGDFFPDPGRGR